MSGLAGVHEAAFVKSPRGQQLLSWYPCVDTTYALRGNTQQRVAGTYVVTPRGAPRNCKK